MCHTIKHFPAIVLPLDHLGNRDIFPIPLTLLFFPPCSSSQFSDFAQGSQIGVDISRIGVHKI